MLFKFDKFCRTHSEFLNIHFFQEQEVYWDYSVYCVYTVNKITF